MTDAPGNWEHGIKGPLGEPNRTFTHRSNNYEPDEINQPEDEDKRKLLELEVYHDAGNDEYYALMHEATQYLNENGDVEETIQDGIIDKEVVQVEGDDGYTSPGHIAVDSHEEAEERIHEEADRMMREHP